MRSRAYDGGGGESAAERRIRLRSRFIHRKICPGVGEHDATEILKNAGLRHLDPGQSC
jgi:hypothetical protein